MRWLVLLALVIVGCSASNNEGSPGDGGTDGGTRDHCLGPLPTASNTPADGGSATTVEVSGLVAYHPAELAWRAVQNDASLRTPPDLTDETVNIEDAIALLINRPPLKSTTIDGDCIASFDITDVNAKGSTRAIVASVGQVEKKDGPRVFTSTFIARPPYPTLLQDVRAFTLSETFFDAMLQILNKPKDLVLIGGLTLIQATDANGAGAAGLKLYQVFGTEPSAHAEEVPGIVYLNSDLTGVESSGVTSSSGVMLWTTAGTAALYTMMEPGAAYLEPGKRHYEVRLIATRYDSVTTVNFAPVP